MKQFVKKNRKKKKAEILLWTSVPIWCFKTVLKNYHFLAQTQKHFSHPLLWQLKLMKETLGEKRSKLKNPLFDMILAIKSCGKVLKKHLGLSKDKLSQKWNILSLGNKI